MRLYHLLAPAQLLMLVETPKTIPNIKFFYNFLKTQVKIPSQLLKNLVVSMPKRAFEVNREN